MFLLGGTLTEVEARAALEDSWTISPLVTSLNNVKETTVDGANNFAEVSGLSKNDLIMTSGVDLPGAHSEDGDYPHIDGYKIDADDTPALTSYIESNFTQDGVREGAHGGSIYTTSINGQRVEAVREDTHWDFTFFPTS